MQTPMILDGKALAKSVEQELQVRVQRIKDKNWYGTRACYYHCRR